MRSFIAVSALGLSGVWLYLMTEPDFGDDPYGYNQLTAMILVSGCVGLLGPLAFWLSRRKKKTAQTRRPIPAGLKISLFLVVPCHLVGSVINAPWCFVPFVLPVAAVIITSVLALMPPLPNLKLSAEDHSETVP